MPNPKVFRVGGSAYRVHDSGLVEHQPAKGQRFHPYSKRGTPPHECLRLVAGGRIAEALRFERAARQVREEAAQAVAAVMALEAGPAPCPTCQGVGADDGSTSGDVACCPDCDGWGVR